jgi:hypothetical protein
MKARMASRPGGVSAVVCFAVSVSHPLNY